jgi:hypothetical protein
LGYSQFYLAFRIGYVLPVWPKVAARISRTNGGEGGLVLRVTSHDKPELGYSLLIPIVGSLLRKLRGDNDY